MAKKKLKTDAIAGSDGISSVLKRPTRWVDQYRFNTENNCLEKYTIEVVVNFPWEEIQTDAIAESDGISSDIIIEGNEHESGNSGISN